MEKIKILVLLPVFLVLPTTGFGDVVVDPVFKVGDLKIVNQFEPRDSNFYDHITLNGCDLTTMAIGKPLLPVKLISVVIPQKEDVVEIAVDSLISEKTVIDGEYWVYPTQTPRHIDGSEPPPFVSPDSAAYASNSPYPGKVVDIGWIGYRSGYKIVNLRVYPVQWTPAQKKLELWTNIYFTIKTKSGINLAVPVYRRSEWSRGIIEAYVRSLVENQDFFTGLTSGSAFRPEHYRGIRTIGSGGKPLLQKNEGVEGNGLRLKVEGERQEAKPLVITGLPSIEGECVDYVIITNEILKDTFQILADWKTKKGVVTQVRTVEWINENYFGCDLAEKIRSFIKDAYSYWGTIWILLAGDVDVVPARQVGILNGPTDLYFSDLDGNWNANGNYLFGEYGVDNCDLFPDLFIGRASVEDATESGIFVRKVLTYENNPATDYLTKMLLLGASLWPWQDTLGNWHYEGEGAQVKEKLIIPTPQGFFPNWFATYELYGPRVDPNPNHIPPYWSGDAELTKANAIAAMNSGNYHIINHIDHCEAYVMGMGRETGGGYLYRSDAMNLTNGPRYFILWTIGCSPNAFDYTAISEALLNCPNGGAVAFIGDSRNTQGSAIEWQDMKFFRTLFVDSLYNLGVLLASTQNPDTIWGIFQTCNMNLLGDPEMPVWTNTPESLVVAHPDTFWLPESIFTVVVKDLAPGETAMVCVQKGTEAYAVGMVPNAESDTLISFVYKPYTPGYLNVTVTGHNYFIYEDSCYVPQYSAFAWLYPYSHFVFDDSLQTYGRVDGNKDGVLNPGEIVQLYLDIANSGAITGYYVTVKLRSNDTLIRIADSVVYYGSIQSGEVAHNDTLSGPGSYFSIYLKPNYPDSVLEYHRIPFEIFIEACRDTVPIAQREWTYSLILTEFCDSLAHSGHKVETISGRTYIYPQITNFGGGSALGVVAILRGIPLTGYEIRDSISVFGEIKSNMTKFNENDPFIYSGPISDLKIVMQDYYGREWIEPLFIDTILPPDTGWANPGEKELEVCWDYITTQEPATLAGYNIYRSESEAGPYARINPMLVTGASLYRDIGLQGYKEYFYKITAVDTSGNESQFSKIASQLTYPDYQAGFPVSVPVGAGGLGFYYSSPAIADIDNDGKDEIAIGAQGRVYLFDDDGTVMPGWPDSLGDFWICSSPALADLNNDDTLEMVIGTGEWGWMSGDQKVHCLDIHGNEISGWPVSVGAQVFASPVIADIDGDGQNEILAVTMAGDAGLYAWESDGTVVPGFPVRGGGQLIPQSPAVADFDNDGIEEILLQTRRDMTQTGNLCLLKYDTDSSKVDTMPGWPQLPDTFYNVWPTHPAICDIDKDDTLEIIAGVNLLNGNASICCLEYDGTLKWQYLGYTPAHISGTSIGDIDKDGEIELIYVIANVVHVIKSNGVLLWKRYVPLTGTWARCSYGTVIGNVDEDIYPEILLGSMNNLWILNHDGTLMQGSPFKLEGDGHSTPAIADIDKDGDVEVICASGGDCKMKVWDLPVPYTRCEWPMFQHDIKHTGRYYTPMRCFLTINQGADTTYSRTVTLNLSAESDSGAITEMRIWDEISNTGWIPYDTSYSWVLTPEDGNKKVYAEFRDVTGTMGIGSDEIYKWVIDVLFTINEDKDISNFKMGLFGFSIQRSEGTVDSVVINQAGQTTRIQYSDTLVSEIVFGDGEKVIEVQFKDALGNISLVYADTILLDTLMPSGTISLPQFTNTPVVLCSLSAEDITSGADSFRLANAPLNNIVPNGDFSDTAGWICNNTTIQGGYAELYGVSGPGGWQAGAAIYQELNPNLFQSGNTYRLCAELITHNVRAVYIALLGHFMAGYDTTLLMVYMPGGNHIYPGDIPLSDTFRFDPSQPLEYLRLIVQIPEIVIPPWPPAETLGATIYLNNIAITPIKPDSIYGDWISYYQDTTVLWPILPEEGIKNVYTQFKDKAGNLFMTFDTTLFEQTPPSGSVVIDLDVDSTNSSFVVLDLEAENGGSGIDEMQISNYPGCNLIENAGFQSGSEDWNQYADFWTSIYFSGDEAGLSITPWAGDSAMCYISQMIPALHFVGKQDSLYSLSLRYMRSGSSIFGGMLLYYYYTDGTQSLADSIDLVPSDTFVLAQDSFWFKPDTIKILNYLEIKILLKGHIDLSGTGLSLDWIKLERSDIATPFTDWEPYQTRKIWQLISGDGERMVYAWFKDKAGNISALINDTVLVNSAIPELAQLVINQQDKATNFHQVNLDFRYYDATDTMILWDDSTLTDWLEPISYQKWPIAQVIPNSPEEEGEKRVRAKFLVKNRTNSFTTFWTDTIIYDITRPDGLNGPPKYPSIIINDGAEYTNSRDVTLTLNSTDNLSGVADMRIADLWYFSHSIIASPKFDDPYFWQTDGQYASIHDGYAEIPAIHKSVPSPYVEYSYIQQEIAVGDLIDKFELLGPYQLKISVDVMNKDFVGNGNLKIAYHYEDGNNGAVSIFNFPEDNRVYWGRRRLGGDFLFNPEPDRVLVGVLIRIDIPVTYGPIPLNSGSIWLDNIEIQPVLPDTFWIDWSAYNTTKDWKLVDLTGINQRVYAQFRDWAGNVSYCVYDWIIYDPLPPVAYLSIPEYYVNDTSIIVNFYTYNSSGIDSAKFANFPYVSFVKNSGFDSEQDWVLDGSYASIHDGYADIPSVHLPGPPPDGDTAYIEQFIPAESVGASIGETLALGLDVITRAFVGDGKAKIYYYYNDGTYDEAMARTINIPEGDSSFIDSLRLWTVFGFTPDTNKIFVRYKIGVYIPVTYGQLILPNSGDIRIDNVSLQKLPPDSLYCAWQEYQPIFYRSLMYGEGIRAVYAKVRDRAGNISRPCWDICLLDTTPPQNCALLINQGAQFTNDPVVRCNLFAQDTLSGMGEMALANFLPENLLTNANFIDSLNNWQYTGGVQVEDQLVHLYYNSTNWGTIWQDVPGSYFAVDSIYRYGLTWNFADLSNADYAYVEIAYVYTDSTGAIADSITILKNVQGQSGAITKEFQFSPDPSKILASCRFFIIAGGEPNLSSVWIDDCILMMPMVDWQWEPYTGQKVWTLTPGDGLKIVFARFKDKAQNLSPVVCDSIILDMTPPIAKIISPRNGAYLTPDDSLPIFGTAKDKNFANYRLKYRTPASPGWYPVEPDSYSTTPVDSGLLGFWNTLGFRGTYSLCLTVSDSVGNVSADTNTVYFLTGTETPPVIDPEFATFSSFPIDVATDALNYVYVTDTGDDKIWKFSEDGDSLLAFGYHATGQDTIGFNKPTGVAIDDSLFIWVTDRLNHCVKKFDAMGNFKFRFGEHGNGPGEFNQPCGIALDNTGFIWVCDNKNDRVQKFDRWGNFILQIPENRKQMTRDKETERSRDRNQCSGLIYQTKGRNEPAPLCLGEKGSTPEDVECSGLIYQTKEMLNQVQHDTSCQIASPAFGGLAMTNEGRVYNDPDQGFALEGSSPKGLLLKKNGAKVSLKQPTGISIRGAMVYITDSKNNRVVVFDTAGNYIYTIGEDDALKLPWDNQVDCFGNLFIADVHNNRIVEFDPWGYKLLGFGVKGDSAGQFNLPHGVALSSDGKYLYVCDTYNNRVQKFLMYFAPESEFADGAMTFSEADLLKVFALYQNYPNPFRQMTVIKYQIAGAVNNKQKTKVSIKIYDVMGRLVKNLVNENKAPGVYEIRWNGTDEKERFISSGVYFFKLSAGNFTATKKMVVLGN